MTFLIGFIGSGITIYWHFKMNYPHLQSMHSWFGILTWLMICFYISYIIYVYDNNQDLNERQRTDMVFAVRLFGIATLIIAGTTCLLGLNQLLSMTNIVTKNSTTLESSEIESLMMINNSSSIELNAATKLRSQANLLANSIAMFMILYIIIMMYIIVRLRYKPRGNVRRQRMERQIRQTIERAMLTIDPEDETRSNNNSPPLFSPPT